MFFSYVNNLCLRSYGTRIIFIILNLGDFTKIMLRFVLKKKMYV